MEKLKIPTVDNLHKVKDKQTKKKQEIYTKILKKCIDEIIIKNKTTTVKKFNQKQAINEYGGKFLSLKNRNIASEFDNLVEDPQINHNNVTTHVIIND